MKEKFRSTNFRGASLQKIVQMRQIVDAYSEKGFRLTARQLYYQMVTHNMISNTVQSYKNTTNLLADARYAGLVDWEAIEDRGRVPTRQSEWADLPSLVRSAVAAFRLPRWEDQDTYAELWVEKQALAGVLEPLAREHHVTLCVNKGYSSASAMYAAAKRYRENSDKDCVLFYLGDHDPSGEDMVRDIRDRLDEFEAPTIDVIKLALTWDQIQQYNPPPNPAKALSLDTLLPTPTGYTTMRAVCPGDLVLGTDGRPCTVTAKSEVFRGKVTYAFTFAGGECIVCSADHLWLVDARKRRSGTRTAQQIAETWYEGTEKRPVYRVRCTAALDLPAQDLAIPPYTLGAWLGNGTAGEGCLACSTAGDQVRREVERDGFRTARHNEIRCQIYGLRKYLHALGIAYDKRIPIEYLRASEAQRWCLLQGLMDTDGTVADPTDQHVGACSYSSSRRGLADDVLALVCTLGLRGRLHESRAVLDGVDMGPTWRVEFFPGDQNVFRLERKRERLRGVAVAERQRWRTLVDVRRVRSVPTACIAVDAPDHLYLVGTQLIPTHNTTDSRAKAYVEKFGDSSWEVDALPPNVLNRLVNDAFAEIIDQETLNAVIEREEAGKQLLRDAAKGRT